MAVGNCPGNMPERLFAPELQVSNAEQSTVFEDRCIANSRVWVTQRCSYTILYLIYNIHTLPHPPQPPRSLRRDHSAYRPNKQTNSNTIHTLHV